MQAKGEVFRRGEGKGINPLPRDWEGRDLFKNLSIGHLHALRHKASADFWGKRYGKNWKNGGKSEMYPIRVPYYVLIRYMMMMIIMAVMGV